MSGNEKAVGSAIKKSGVPREEPCVYSKVYPTGSRVRSSLLSERLVTEHFL